ncbi:hypothetical protein TNIN_341691 [Trichonephila inaurata madagascariensis]|uniref:Uncharacterized protein n=1 Tax=Trichonephila inaurata madagascariensis TaxID=2747483 RepID=A0A8X6Y798_9ARAC|nr:hypothetical protein TNIN_341691 [Trichonephila inaurata madagascariensis]
MATATTVATVPGSSSLSSRRSFVAFGTSASDTRRKKEARNDEAEWMHQNDNVSIFCRDYVDTILRNIGNKRTRPYLLSIYLERLYMRHHLTLKALEHNVTQLLFAQFC